MFVNLMIATVYVHGLGYGRHNDGHSIDNDHCNSKHC